MCFFDFTKAFDRIKLRDVVEVLRKERVNGTIINLISTESQFKHPPTVEPGTGKINPNSIGTRRLS